MPSDTRVLVGGVTLGVRTWEAVSSSHPPVALLSATAETADDWDVVARVLARTRTVHAVDMRGHGDSDWPGVYSIELMARDVEDLLPRLAAHPIDLIGHSLGGLVACDVASAHPALVRRLVIEDIGLLHPRTAVAPTRPTGGLPFDWRMVEQVRPEIDAPDPLWPGVVAAITAPILVVAGGPISPIPQEHVADLARQAQHGQLTTIDAGHFVHTTEPGASLKATMRFLDNPG